MKIGAMVGRTEDGQFEYLGKPGDMTALVELANGIRAKGGKVGIGKDKRVFTQITIADVTRHPMFRKKC